MGFKMSKNFDGIPFDNAYFKIDHIVNVYRAKQINITGSMYYDKASRDANGKVWDTFSEVIRDYKVTEEDETITEHNDASDIFTLLDGGLSEEGQRTLMYKYLMALEKFTNAVMV